MSKDRAFAVVVGANGAVGKATARRLNEIGYRVAHVARSFEEGCYNPVGEDLLVECDLQNEEHRATAWQKICQWTNRLDLLVNAAGMAYGAPAMMTRLSDLRRVYEVNYFSVIDFSQRAARLMARRKQGVILNLSSVQGCIAEPGNLAYGGSKAALGHSTRVMATEFGKLGVRVNAIAPTLIKSRMMDLMDEKSQARLIEMSALSSCLEIEEIVHMIEFLCSAGARNISGQVIRIDGGMSF